MDEPVEYVGGLGDGKRPRAWPYVAVAVALVMVAVGALVFRNQIASGGRALGESVVPYSLDLTASQWSMDEKLTGVPVTLTLQVQNKDPRTINGLTIRLIDLNPQLKVTGTKPPAEIRGSTIFFPEPLAPSKTETLSITLLPGHAGDWRFGLTITPDHGTTAARVQTADGTVLTTLHARAAVRDPKPSDASAQVTARWGPEVPVGGATTWQVLLMNDGPVTIPSVTLGFPQVPRGFELVDAGPQVSLLDDGRLKFDAPMRPGAQATLTMRLIAHEAGDFQVPIDVYLGDATQPITSGGGAGPSLSIDITVS
jgi:hypothetical protein